MINALILTAGGLDSLLTIKLMERTKIPFRVVHFDIGLTHNKAIVAGLRISKYFGLENLIKNSIEIEKFDVAKEFYTQILNTRDFNDYNACLEYKIFILKKAKEYMQEIGAQFIVTGDVVDQRPLIQGKDALLTTDIQADVENIVFRPLSANLLAPSLLLTSFPKLSQISYDFTGFSQKRIELAKILKIEYTPSISEKQFDKNNTELAMGNKAFEIFEKQKKINISHINRIGLHFKLNSTTRCVIGRTPFESNYLKKFYEKIEKKDFAFSSNTPNFLFGFMYGSLESGIHETLALKIFSAIVSQYKNSPDIQLFDDENLLLGSRVIEPLSQKELEQYVLYSNEMYCPIISLDIQ